MCLWVTHCHGPLNDLVQCIGGCAGGTLLASVRRCWHCQCPFSGFRRFDIGSWNGVVPCRVRDGYATHFLCWVVWRAQIQVLGCFLSLKKNLIHIYQTRSFGSVLWHQGGQQSRHYKQGRLHLPSSVWHGVPHCTVLVCVSLVSGIWDLAVVCFGFCLLLLLLLYIIFFKCSICFYFFMFLKYFFYIFYCFFKLFFLFFWCFLIKLSD